MTGRRLYVITFAVMLSLFLASIESTVVATAMPTIVAQLGGFTIYAWVFSAYMLASTTAVPVFGKLSDIYGRRAIYLIAMAIFLIGSILCGIASSMEQLVFYRAIQGLGAGGLMPLAFTIIGDIFSFEQRAKMQGWFSGVWGVSSIIGPLLGGFLVNSVGWHWIFLINIPPGLLAAGLMLVAWRDVNPRHEGKVDYIGAALLTAGVIALLLAMMQLNARQAGIPIAFWILLATAFVLLGALLFVEQRAANPILPIPLFRERLFATATGHGFLSGFAVFGAVSFIPLFVESVLGTDATVAGATLTPMMLGWVSGSVVSSRLLLKFSPRALALIGMSALVCGAALMTLLTENTSQLYILICVALMGIGMGLSVPPFLIAVQSSVPRQSLGAATATVQFSRSIGGTIGVSVLGVILAIQFASAMTGAGLDPDTVSLSALLDADSNASAAQLGPVRAAIAVAVQSVFVATFIVAIGAWIVTTFAPRGRIGAKSPVPPEEVSAESLPVD
ncbi:MAG: MFS transporter [Chloroflexi bacterium]|nr:MFS transporter [Chloroflexota bacterium]